MTDTTIPITAVDQIVRQQERIAELERQLAIVTTERDEAVAALRVAKELSENILSPIRPHWRATQNLALRFNESADAILSKYPACQK